MEQVAQQGKCQSNVIENSTGGFLTEKSSKEKWVMTIKVVEKSIKCGVGFVSVLQLGHWWWSRVVKRGQR